MSEGVGLAKAISALRAELIQAQKDGLDSDLRFDVGDVEVELAIEVTADVKGEASVKVLGVLSIGGGATSSSGETSKVKVRLKPRGTRGNGYQIGSKQRQRPDGTPAAHDKE